MSEQQISREQLGYLAGILDGEGCISVGIHYLKHTIDPKHKRNQEGFYRLLMNITISNHDVRVIKRVSEIYKALGIGFFYTTAKKKDGKTWIININTTGKGSARKLLNAVGDMLVGKTDQVKYFLELAEYRDSLGYGKKGFKICDDPKIQRYVQRIRDLKHEFPSLPSETKRRANQVLEFD